MLLIAALHKIKKNSKKIAKKNLKKYPQTKISNTLNTKKYSSSPIALWIQRPTRDSGDGATALHVHIYSLRIEMYNVHCAINCSYFQDTCVAIQKFARRSARVKES